MNEPPTVTRFVLISDASGEGVAAVVAPYAPDLYVVTSDHSELVRALGTMAPAARLEGDDLCISAERIAAERPGQTIAIVANAEQLRLLLCHALGVPTDAAERFLIVADAISVLEVDLAMRWAVVRLNEGRPLPGDR